MENNILTRFLAEGRLKRVNCPVKPEV